MNFIIVSGIFLCVSVRLLSLSPLFLNRFDETSFRIRYPVVAVSFENGRAATLVGVATPKNLFIWENSRPTVSIGSGCLFEIFYFIGIQNVLPAIFFDS